jgi:predicted Zn-ribbon and HTH transcriptional regulator
MNDNREVVSETARIFSNISRYSLPYSNNIIHLTKIATLLLDHQDLDVITYSCGILMNLLKNNVSKEVMELKGAEKYKELIRILEIIQMALQSENYKLATLSSQALYNLFKSTEISNECTKGLRNLLLEKQIPQNIQEILSRINTEIEKKIN